METSSQHGQGPAASATGPLGRLLLLVLLAIPTAAHVPEIFGRGIDPDEFEHLHASYLVSLGDVPYRDFFEHHGPALYYLAQPLFWIFGPNLNVLWAGRGVCLACGLAGAWLASRLARKLAGPDVGLVAGCLVVWSTVFHLKALEFRPDVPALLCVMLTATLVWKSQIPDPKSQGVWPLVVAGFVAGLGTLFTQKSIVPVAGIWLGWVVARLINVQTREGEASAEPLGEPGRNLLAARQEPRPAARALRAVVAGTVALLLGGLGAWGIAFGLFALKGAADDLWRGAVAQLWAWPLRMSPLDQLRPIVAADFVVWFVASWELLYVAVELLFGQSSRAGATGSARFFERTLRPMTLPVAVCAAWCVLSLLWVKAAYAQFHLLCTPFLAILAARRLAAWAMDRPGWIFTMIASGLALLLALMQFELWTRALLADESALPWLQPTMLQATLAVQWGLLLGFAATLFAAVRGLRRRAVLFLALLGSFYGSMRILDAHIWPNDDDVAMVRAVERYVPPDGRVLDGFSGYAPFRRHAWYYWWINEHSRALFGNERLTSELLPLLKQSPPAGILFDAELGRQDIPAGLRGWIEQNYEETTWPPLWVPRGSEK